MTSHEAVNKWCDAVLAGDAEAAWCLTEPAYRQIIAERRAKSAGRALDDPAVAESVRTFSEEGRDEAAYRVFAELQRWLFERLLPEEWRALRDGGGRLPEEWLAFAHEHGLPEEGRPWGRLGQPRHVDADCELVQLVDASPLAEEGETGDMPITANETLALTGALDFYMRRDAEGRWLLAGLNEFPPDWLEVDGE